MMKMDYGGGHPSNWVRLCDSCRLSASTLYCHNDSAYLCSSCDGQIHAMGSPCWCHNRVKLCGSCENAPVAFICKADDASLCVDCDFEIHSANPIASRHNRVPVSPLSHILNDNVATPDEQPNYEVVVKNNISSKEVDEQEADSWLLLDSADTIDSQVDDGFMFGVAEDDHHAYVGLVEESDSSTKFKNFQEDRDQGKQAYSFSEEMKESDSVVPVQSVAAQPKQLQPQHQQNIYFNVEKKPSRVAFTNYASNCRSVAVPCMGSQMLQSGTMCDMPGFRFPKGTETFPSASVPMQIHFGHMNRKAGVEKYREKKKSRKFEKRIRYAYRKAYAEKRPRVKGRFVKRQDLTSDEAVPLH
ncbi:zinc finger protein CONSTANS-LIKE 1 isoform X2 [Neltuma alba]|uniref:zinc finger protein CONSTANS-LIKE 1 isoform X2 n=1 Tax=Neltuma alba TaxID=207710 RepID=UPI0010A4A382|nr:zinc finger protein CONSTANS-LIKE 1-like isoform X2 [Prosopis alba]